MNEQTKMDKLVTEMAEHICDKLCKYPGMKFEGDECIEDICCDCKMEQFVCDILNTYNELNDFEKSQTHKLLQTISELKKQIPAFKIGETAYLVDFEEGVIDESVINGTGTRTDRNKTEFEYDSDLLYFYGDDIGKCVFISREEAEEALRKENDNEKS